MLQSNSQQCGRAFQAQLPVKQVCICPCRQERRQQQQQQQQQPAMCTQPAHICRLTIAPATQWQYRLVLHCKQLRCTAHLQVDVCAGRQQQVRHPSCPPNPSMETCSMPPRLTVYLQVDVCAGRQQQVHHPSMPLHARQLQRSASVIVCMQRTVGSHAGCGRSLCSTRCRAVQRQALASMHACQGIRLPTGAEQASLLFTKPLPARLPLLPATSHLRCQQGSPAEASAALSPRCPGWPPTETRLSCRESCE